MWPEFFGQQSDSESLSEQDNTSALMGCYHMLLVNTHFALLGGVKLLCAYCSSLRTEYNK